MDYRIGQGYDVHAFGPGDHLFLGGVRIEHSQALIAHSDGDVVIHALCDAMLGALALGDIGTHFPPSQARWKHVSSVELLSAVTAMLQPRGYGLGNADITIICEAPCIAPHVQAMCKLLGQTMQVAMDAVSVKATTSERLGFTGRGEGIAALATVLLSRCS